jgi:small subunit ribosomal protein S11
MAEEIKPTEKTGKSAAQKTESAEAGAKKDEKVTVKATKKSKAKRRIVTEGRVYIQASFNNTITTVTDPNGEVLSWSSAGANGFKGPKKATPYAAQVTSENAITKAKVYGLEKVQVFIKGAGNGREQSVRGILAGGVNIESITDLTPIAHNGCRQRKSRRV